MPECVGSALIMSNLEVNLRVKDLHDRLQEICLLVLETNSFVILVTTINQRTLFPKDQRTARKYNTEYPYV